MHLNNLLRVSGILRIVLGSIFFMSFSSCKKHVKKHVFDPVELAKALGKPQAEIDLYAKRAMNYKNVYDDNTQLMRGRNADGSFQSPFSPYKWGDAFTEGNSWHYTWSVFQDVEGLVNRMPFHIL